MNRVQKHIEFISLMLSANSIFCHSTRFVLTNYIKLQHMCILYAILGSYLIENKLQMHLLNLVAILTCACFRYEVLWKHAGLTECYN